MKEEGGTMTACAEKTGRWAWRRPDGSLAPLRGDVRFQKVDFGYEAGQPILKGISLYAEPGQKIAFVGSTGAGKTTITNLINRFYEVQGGGVTYDGIDVRDIKRTASAAPWASSFRIPTCLRAPLPTTSVSASWMPLRRRSSGPPASPTRTPSSADCPRAMRPW